MSLASIFVHLGSFFLFQNEPNSFLVQLLGIPTVVSSILCLSMDFVPELYSLQCEKEHLEEFI